MYGVSFTAFAGPGVCSCIECDDFSLLDILIRKNTELVFRMLHK